MSSTITSRGAAEVVGVGREHADTELHAQDGLPGVLARLGGLLRYWADAPQQEDQPLRHLRAPTQPRWVGACPTDRVRHNHRFEMD